jgi:nitroimidazol reductase NimA-like FMN-containing flavoprotein (pyridoxamine 5'-phosphate oxidase superfamily)
VAGILLVMDTDSRELEHLSREECMRLMGSVPVGRIVYTRQALPAVELVNFALVDGDIVIRTNAEGKLAAATRGAVVAFEADTVDIDGHAGWSVAIVGQARAVTDGEEIRRLERVALTSWVPGQRGHFIRISPTIVNGRRVGSQRLTGAHDAHRH